MIKMRQAGASTRAIAATEGIDQKQVRRDLERATEDMSSVDLPAKAVGLDGRERPARRAEPKREEQEEEPEEPA